IGCGPRGWLLTAARSLKAVQAGGRWRRGVWGSRPQSIFVTTGGRAPVLGWLGGSCDRLLVRWLLDRGERLLAELAQDVVGAPAELARDREAGAVVAEPLGDLEVVAAVGRAGAGGRDGRFVQRPAQHFGPLVREVAGRALVVGLVDGDVQAGVADGVVRGGEAAAIAELGQDRGRADWPDPVQALNQRATAGLAAGIGAQLAVERREHAQPQRDEPSSGGRKLRSPQRLPPGLRASQSAGHPLVEQLRVHALLPGGALIDQRLAQAHQRAQLEDLRQRDPRLGQL